MFHLSLSFPPSGDSNRQGRPIRQRQGVDLYPHSWFGMKSLHTDSLNDSLPNRGQVEVRGGFSAGGWSQADECAFESTQACGCTELSKPPKSNKVGRDRHYDECNAGWVSETPSTHCAIAKICSRRTSLSSRTTASPHSHKR